MFLQKRSFLTAAVLASLSLTACGKKQDLYSPPPSNPQNGDANTQDAPPAKPTKEKSDTTKDPKDAPAVPRSSKPGSLPDGGLGGGFDSEDDNSQTQPSIPKGTDKNPYGDSSGGSHSAPAKPTPRPRTETENPRSDDSRPTPFTPVDSNYKNLTGGTSKEGLSYTSSAPDDLISFLRERNNKVSADIRRGNLALAGAMSSASLEANEGNAKVTLRLIEAGKVQTYVLDGELSAGPAKKLSLSRAGTTGANAADGTLKCVDGDGGCQNVFARLRIGTPGSASIVSVVFRTAGANLFFQMPQTNSGRNEYETLRGFFHNTLNRTGERITRSRIISWEVVNGRSGFSVILNGNNDETLAFSGPLLATTDGSPLSEVVENRSRTRYASWITGARLVANDTHGRLDVRFALRTGDKIVIKFTRQVEPLIDITDDNLR